MLGEGDNDATFTLAPGYSKFSTYCAELGINNDYKMDKNPIIVNDAQLISDDETHKDSPKDEQWVTPQQTPFNLNGLPIQSGHQKPAIILDEEDRHQRTSQLTS